MIALVNALNHALRSGFGGGSLHALHFSLVLTLDQPETSFHPNPPVSEETQQFSKLADELISSLRRLPQADVGRMRKRPTKALSDLVEALIVKHSIGLSSPEQSIRDNWLAIVGSANASYSHASQIDPKGRLIVLAAHAVVRNELFLHRSKIVEKLQKIPGCGHIREIHLRAG